MTTTNLETLNAKAQVLIDSLTRAYKRLQETKDFPKDLPHREATIQRFEFSFELSWKLMKALANLKGTHVYNPKDAIRAAAQQGLISNPEAWISFANARNLAAHTYNEKTALSIYKDIAKFIPLVEELLENAHNEKM